jgi:hypothetical protein
LKVGTTTLTSGDSRSPSRGGGMHAFWLGCLSLSTAIG